MSARKRALRITWREAWPIWLTFGLLFGFGAIGVWVLLPAAQIPMKALAAGEDLTVSTGDLQPDMPRIFAYPVQGGRATDFFVEREANGIVTVAFASCRRCYRSGHFRQGGHILCDRCSEPMMRALTGQALPADADCTQIPIPFESSGDHITIRVSTVRETFMRWYGPMISHDTAPAARKPGSEVTAVSISTINPTGTAANTACRQRKENHHVQAKNSPTK